MAAYILADVQITDPEQYAKYRALSSAAFDAHGVKPLARGGATERLEGREPGRIVVLPFDVDGGREGVLRVARIPCSARRRAKAQPS